MVGFIKLRTSQAIIEGKKCHNFQDISQDEKFFITATSYMQNGSFYLHSISRNPDHLPHWQMFLGILWLFLEGCELFHRLGTFGPRLVTIRLFAAHLILQQKKVYNTGKKRSCKLKLKKFKFTA